MNVNHSQLASTVGNRLPSDVSFLMLKPDCLARPDMVAAAQAMLEATGLSLVAVVDHVLTAQDLSFCWPQLINEGNPITSALLQLYLQNQRTRLVVVVGDNAVASVKAVKKEFRRAYASGSLANLVHCPADASEAVTQLLRFGGEPFSSLPPMAFRVPEPRGGVWGAAAERDSKSLVAAAHKIWRRAVADGWDRIAHVPFGDGATALILGDDERNTLDYVVSALMCLFPDWSPETVLTAVLHADREGTCTLVRGERLRLQGLAASLDEFGLTVRIIDEAACTG